MIINREDTKLNKTKTAILGLLLSILYLNGCEKFQKDIIIPQTKIQEMVDHKFPFDKNIVIARLTLDSPSVYFKNENIGMKLNYFGNFLNKEVKGVVDFNGQLIYKKDKGAFYLSQFEIVEISINENNYSDMEKLKSSISNITTNYLDDYPVYRLNQKDFKQSLALLFLKEIKVNSSSLIITMGL